MSNSYHFANTLTYLVSLPPDIASMMPMGYYFRMFLHPTNFVICTFLTCVSVFSYSAKSGYDEMLVHTSPNGKSSYTRSISPDSRSQSPRYPSKSSYHRDSRLKDYRDHRDYRDRDRHRGGRERIQSDQCGRKGMMAIMV